MPTFRDIDLEDIPRALRLAGSPYRTLDHNDYAKAIMALQATTGFGQDHLRLDRQDMPEALIGASGGFGGDVPIPTKDMDLTLPAIGSQLTCTRAGVGYAESRAGVWSSFATNVPRITDKGLLVEEGRTNSLGNNSMTGAVAGNPGTLPTGWAAFGDALETGMFHQVVGTGTINGIDYIDLRFFGTPVQGWFEVDFGPGPIAAAPGQNWTGSLFWWLMAGSIPVFNPGSGAFMAFSASGGATLLEVNIAPTASGRRSVSAVAPANTVAVTLGLYFEFPQPYVPYDFTFRIGWPQVEQGGFMTSPIRTTNAAVARAADSIAVNDVSGVNTAAFTMFFDFTTICNAAGRSVSGVLGGWARTLAFLDTAYASLGNTGLVSSNVVIGGTGVFGTSRAIADQKPAKIAYGVQLNDGRTATNGDLHALDTVVPIATPGAVASLKIGSAPYLAAANNVANAYIRRFSLWNTRLPDAQLRQATS